MPMVKVHPTSVGCRNQRGKDDNLRVPLRESKSTPIVKEYLTNVECPHQSGKGKSNNLEVLFVNVQALKRLDVFLSVLEFCSAASALVLSEHKPRSSTRGALCARADAMPLEP